MEDLRFKLRTLSLNGIAHTASQNAGKGQEEVGQCCKRSVLSLNHLYALLWHLFIFFVCTGYLEIYKCTTPHPD